MERPTITVRKAVEREARLCRLLTLEGQYRHHVLSDRGSSGNGVEMHGAGLDLRQTDNI